MTDVLVVRHGQTYGNIDGRFYGHSETELTPVGVQQAQALGRKLAAREIHAAYTSDLTRAAETARHILAGRTPLPELRIDDRLREMHYGDWEALHSDEIREKQPDLMRDFFSARAHSAPGGETIQQLRARTVAAVKDAVDAHPDGTILVVSHGNAIMALFAELIGVPVENTWQFSVRNTSISHLRFGKRGRPMLMSFNDMAHADGIEGQETHF